MLRAPVEDNLRDRIVDEDLTGDEKRGNLVRTLVSAQLSTMTPMCDACKFTYVSQPQNTRFQERFGRLGTVCWQTCCV